MAKIRDHSKVKVAHYYADYLADCDQSYEQCLQDYKAGKGVAAYYQHVGRIRSAHRTFELRATGEIS